MSRPRRIQGLLYKNFCHEDQSTTEGHKHGPKGTVQLPPVLAVEESTDWGRRSNLIVLSACTLIYISSICDSLGGN